MGNVALWAFQPETSVLDPESRTVYVVSGLFLILMVVGLVMSWQIRRANMPVDSSPTQQMASGGPFGQPMAQLSKNNNNQHHVMMHPSTSTSFVQMVATQRPQQQGPIGQIPVTYH